MKSMTAQKEHLQFLEELENSPEFQDVLSEIAALEEFDECLFEVDIDVPRPYSLTY